MSDEKHEEILRLSSSLIEKEMGRFLSRYSSLRTLWRTMITGTWARGVLPYMGYIGIFGHKGYGFSAVLVINRVSIIAILSPLW